MNEARLLHLLKEEQSRFAVQALRQPAQRDAFEYGHRVGFYAGLEQAVTVLLKAIEADNTKEF